MPVDPHRPIYHFTVDQWMNDPIPFFWDGQYHVFFQHNPAEAGWGLMHWGHAVSRDLVHWDEMPIALTPTPVACAFQSVGSPVRASRAAMQLRLCQFQIVLNSPAT